MEKVTLVEKRLKEAGLPMEQSGHHELIREIHRLQLWIQSLNAGWASNMHPETWTPSSAETMYSSSGAVRKGIGRTIQSDSIRTSQIQSNQNGRPESAARASMCQQLVDVHRRIGILETEANRLQQSEIGALKECCRKIEQKIPELERELRASKEKIEAFGTEACGDHQVPNVQGIEHVSSVG